MVSNGGGRRIRGVVFEVFVWVVVFLEFKNFKDNGGCWVDIFQVREEEKIYDFFLEVEYNFFVVKRREEVKNFVVVDDGLGYVDIGEEEDWNVDQYSGGSEDEDGGIGKKKKKNVDGKIRE